MAGDGIWWVGLAWVATQVGDPGFVGVVLAVGGAPRLMLLLLGGTLADRLGARRVMLAADAAAVVVCVLVGAASATLGPGPILLLTAAFTFGTLEAFYFPSSSALLPLVRGDVPMPRAAAALQTVGGAAAVVGRSVGGVVVAGAGLTAVAFANAATFVASFGLVARIGPSVHQPKTSGGAGVLKDARDGVGLVLRDPILRQVSLIALALNAAVMPLTQVGVALSADERSWGATGLGGVAAGVGFGMVAGSVLALVLPAPKRPGRRLVQWMGFAVVCLFIAVTTDLLVLAIAAYGATYVCMGPLNALLTSIVLTRAPDDVRGRVSAVLALIGGAALPFANAVFGLAVGWTNLVQVQLVCLGLTGAVVATVATSRAFRSLEG